MIWPFDRAKKNNTATPPGYPTGYVVDASRPDVFDPALKHYPRAFVKGPPVTEDDARALDAARSRLLQRCLQALARSSVGDALVLRGSLTLEAWFPERARRAHDIDFVVRDAAIGPDSASARTLLTGIRQAVRGALVEGDVHVIEDEIALDSIWTYERAEGRRLSVPWIFSGSMRDAIQIDIVFREPLQDTPTLEVLRDVVETHGYRDAPAGPSLWFASRAESLAWKLLWLGTDYHPQAKDLYDAVLLAEHVMLPLQLLRRVFVGKGEKWEHGFDTAHIRNWDIEWESFALEYPELAAGHAEAWRERLMSALVLVA